jgi:hypothetical protein
MMFTSIDDASGKCWRMCLTDTNMNNLPTGTTIDLLLQEWLQVEMMPITFPYRHSHLQWRGPVGQHTVSVKVSENTTYYATLKVSHGHGIQHFFLQIPPVDKSLSILSLKQGHDLLHTSQRDEACLK